jgi:hypothetical protein
MEIKNPGLALDKPPLGSLAMQSGPGLVMESLINDVRSEQSFFVLTESWCLEGDDQIKLVDHVASTLRRFSRFW